MASSVDLKVVIQHIVNGTLSKNLCLVCLMPLDEQSEHILTTICRDDKEYCIADVFQQILEVHGGMASSVDLKVVIQHIVNGTLSKNLCLVCLMPLDEQSEHILTTICRDDKEYCIADVFQQILEVHFSDISQNQVCSDCFITASAAYKFYLSAKRSQEILNFYTNELQQNMDFIDTDLQNSEDSICISLPIFTPTTEAYDYDLEGLALQAGRDNADAMSDDGKHVPKSKNDLVKVKTEVEVENEVVIVMDGEGKPSFLKQGADGSLNLVDKEDEMKYMKMFGFANKTAMPIAKPEKAKQQRRRNRMTYMFCSRCPVKYRFIGKLKEHMKVEHNVDLYICQVCKASMEDEEEYNNHLKTHTNKHTCAICNVVFKKRSTIISHLKKHEDELRRISIGSHICELCGQVLEDEEHLKQHYEKKHVKKYTCYYCGKMYKGETSFDSHIKKHEEHLKEKDTRSEPVKEAAPSKKRDKKFKCDHCGKSFMDERTLMWHTRLHTNERPHVCDVCGRGFVSVNRRNQHVLCAHSAPARRCPLCPALFHLRSMVNTHIKKVHLKTHKRRNRTSKYQEVYWRTEPVPIEELSVSIQNEILELKAAQEAKEVNKSANGWNLNDL